MGKPTTWKVGLLSVATALALAACDGSGVSHSASDPAPTGPAATKANNIAEAIAINEAAGRTPDLDRSGSVEGPDSNDDGVRDDVEDYINSLDASGPQKAASRQLSKALRAALTADADDEDALREAIRQMNDAVACMWERYPAEDAANAVADMQKVMVNTRERYDAYADYNSAVSGTVVSLPKEMRCED